MQKLSTFHIFDGTGRKAFKVRFPMCQFPGCRKRATDCHEIARGIHRKSSMEYWCGLLQLCREHHNDLHGNPSVARDLAVKRLAGDGFYDRVGVNLLRGRQPEAITEDEVDRMVQSFKESLE